MTEDMKWNIIGSLLGVGLLGLFTTLLEVMAWLS